MQAQRYLSHRKPTGTYYKHSDAGATTGLPCPHASSGPKSPRTATYARIALLITDRTAAPVQGERWRPCERRGGLSGKCSPQSDSRREPRRLRWPLPGRSSPPLLRHRVPTPRRSARAVGRPVPRSGNAGRALTGSGAGPRGLLGRSGRAPLPECFDGAAAACVSLVLRSGGSGWGSPPRGATGRPECSAWRRLWAAHRQGAGPPEGARGRRTGLGSAPSCNPKGKEVGVGVRVTPRVSRCGCGSVGVESWGAVESGCGGCGEGGGARVIVPPGGSWVWSI